MGRKVLLAAATSVLFVLWLVPAAQAATTINLVLPQGDAFAVLGHSCGGIQEQTYATGFDGTTGYPVGDVYAKTSCGGSGRGGGYHVTTYTAWIGVTWDFTGAVVSYANVTTPVTVDPNLTAFDAYGNEVANASNSATLTLAPGYVARPRVTSVSVSAGPAAGGTTVTIAGDAFTGASAVSFGATPAASFTVNGDTSITAVSPVSAPGTVDITVTSAGGTSAAALNDQFTFVAAPTVTSISPNSGPIAGGTSVTITGTGFTGATQVSFGGNATGFTINGDTSITAVSPAIESPDTAHVTVTSVGGTSATSGADQFTYTPNPAWSYTTNYTTAEQPRVLQSAAYLGVTPEQLQKVGVQLIEYLLALSNPRPAPSPANPAPSLVGPVAYTTTWTLADVAQLQDVEAQYSLSPEQAQKLGVQLVDYLLILGGH